MSQDCKKVEPEQVDPSTSACEVLVQISARSTTSHTVLSGIPQYLQECDKAIAYPKICFFQILPSLLFIIYPSVLGYVGLGTDCDAK